MRYESKKIRGFVFHGRLSVQQDNARAGNRERFVSFYIVI